MTALSLFLAVAALGGSLTGATPSTESAAGGRWSSERIQSWWQKQPWLLGCNFTPSTAINQLEFWQAETFDAKTIDRELGFAAGLGMNVVRVYLHDLAYLADPKGFKSRVRTFLQLASKHKIRPLIVFFDDCWNDDPKIGLQPAPKKGVHNSGWVKSPGLKVAFDETQWPRLEGYVKDVLRTFGKDRRVLAWDLYNEPGNHPDGRKSEPLLRAVFRWAREVGPSQPLTVGAWGADPEFDRIMIELSDLVTFHFYNPMPGLPKRLEELRAAGRPLLCTEWMIRPEQSAAEFLPFFRSQGVGAINWGLVSGKTNTIYRWGNPEGSPVPDLWFHDLLHPDGTPFKSEEVEVFRRESRLSKSISGKPRK